MTNPNWPELKGEGHFDLIHARLIFLAAKTDVWPAVVKGVYNRLKPGGWFESQELLFPIQLYKSTVVESKPEREEEEDVSDDPSSKNYSPVHHWSSMLVAATSKRGVDVSSPARFPTMLSETGFTDVHEERLRWPLGPWSSHLPGSEDARREKEIGRLARENFLDGLGMFVEAFGGKALGWTEKVKEDLVMAVNEELGKVGIDEGARKWLMDVRVVWGRKPV